MKIPDFLTRHYVKGEDPFLSLNMLPLDRANQVKRLHDEKYKYGGFYAQDDYLVHRREIERWMYARFIEKGGRPRMDAPVYMFLGAAEDGCYDYGPESAALEIPLSQLDLSAISFVFPDSMYRYIFDEAGVILRAERTNQPYVYLYDELVAVMERLYPAIADYAIRDAGRSQMIEAQVWDREMCLRYYEKLKASSSKARAKRL